MFKAIMKSLNYPNLLTLQLEEVTAPASLEALYSHFHFAQPGGSRTKRRQKGWSLFGHLLSILFIIKRAFQKVNIYLASLTNLFVETFKKELSFARLQFFNYLASMFEPFLKLSDRLSNATSHDWRSVGVN